MNIEELYEIYLQYPSIQTDTRKLKSGELFFALSGTNFNGNEFAAKAIENGAAYAIIDKADHVIPGKTILVEDVLRTLQSLAKHHRQQFTIPFIAITGSNGKTTTKELINAVLSSSFKTYTTEGNLNNHIGVPLTLLKIKNDAVFAVIEMGANHLQEIASYCQIALPTHGLITNCGKAHLEGFGSEEGVRKGKGELYDFLRHYNGGAFVMWDYDYLQDMSKGIQTIYKYGTHDADIIGNVWTSNPLLEVNLTKGMTENIKTKLVGSYNLPNVLAAVAIGKFFGVYNANPSSMKLAIENFAKSPEANKILVLGAMAELGADSLREHQYILNTIKGYDWQNVLLVGEDFTKLSHSFVQFNTSTEAGEWLKTQNIQNALLLIKGSRSTKMEKVLDYLES
jgi:UDP-N-acetylmuramoyl-tripeptide--D-alanyl-D-alanine ligase